MKLFHVHDYDMEFDEKNPRSLDYLLVCHGCGDSTGSMNTALSRTHFSIVRTVFTIATLAGAVVYGSLCWCWYWSW